MSECSFRLINKIDTVAARIPTKCRLSKETPVCLFLLRYTVQLCTYKPKKNTLKCKYSTDRGVFASSLVRKFLVNSLDLLLHINVLHMVHVRRVLRLGMAVIAVQGSLLSSCDFVF